MKKSKSNLRHLPQSVSLSRLLTGATFGLSVLVVVAVAQSPRPDAAYAQSAAATPENHQSATTKQPTTSSVKSSSTKHQSTVTNKTSTATSYNKSTTTNAVQPTFSNGSTPTLVPTTSPGSAPASSGYPLHTNIKTTYFWAGEAASADNDFIQNVSSAWQTDWQKHYGGSDDPDNRCGYHPCAFTPKENPFYFALPFGDYTTSGPVSDLSMVYWYDSARPMQSGQSILKNRWIQIHASPNGVNKTVYAQWQDVGPFNEHDGAYVFGTAAPASTRAGLDVSPAVRDYLGMGGSTITSWKFVEAADVPNGPWKNIVTTSGPDWF